MGGPSRCRRTCEVRASSGGAASRREARGAKRVWRGGAYGGRVRGQRRRTHLAPILPGSTVAHLAAQQRRGTVRRWVWCELRYGCLVTPSQFPCQCVCVCVCVCVCTQCLPAHSLDHGGQAVDPPAPRRLELDLEARAVLDGRLPVGRCIKAVWQRESAGGLSASPLSPSHTRVPCGAGKRCPSSAAGGVS